MTRTATTRINKDIQDKVDAFLVVEKQYITAFIAIPCDESECLRLARAMHAIAAGTALESETIKCMKRHQPSA